jgi:hypothetical protein
MRALFFGLGLLASPAHSQTLDFVAQAARAGGQALKLTQQANDKIESNAAATKKTLEAAWSYHKVIELYMKSSEPAGLEDFPQDFAPPSTAYIWQAPFTPVPTQVIALDIHDPALGVQRYAFGANPQFSMDKGREHIAQMARSTLMTPLKNDTGSNALSCEYIKVGNGTICRSDVHYRRATLPNGSKVVVSIQYSKGVCKNLPVLAGPYSASFFSSLKPTDAVETAEAADAKKGNQVIWRAEAGERYEILRIQDGWGEVKNADGKTGWIELLKLKRSET